jgi:hypothetical protein
MIPVVLSLEPVRTSLWEFRRSTVKWRALFVALGDRRNATSVKRLCPEGDVSLGEQNAGTELKHHKIHIKVSYRSVMCLE